MRAPERLVLFAFMLLFSTLLAIAIVRNAERGGESVELQHVQ